MPRPTDNILEAFNALAGREIRVRLEPVPADIEALRHLDQRRQPFAQEIATPAHDPGHYYRVDESDPAVHEMTKILDRHPGWRLRLDFGAALEEDSPRWDSRRVKLRLVIDKTGACHIAPRPTVG